MKLLAKIIDGADLAEMKKDKIKSAIQQQKSLHPTLTLKVALVQVGSCLDQAEFVKELEECGVKTSMIRLSNEVEEEQIKYVMKSLNDDLTIHGIVMEVDPCLTTMNKDDIYDLITPSKDIEGMCSFNAKMLKMDQSSSQSVVPSQAAAIMELISSTTGKPFYCWGKKVVVLTDNISAAAQVGVLMSNNMADVTILLHSEANVAEIARGAEILIIGVGQTHSINGLYVKEGAIVFDLGLNVQKEHNGKWTYTGDVDDTSVHQRASAIITREAVQKVTRMCMLENLVKLALVLDHH